MYLYFPFPTHTPLHALLLFFSLQFLYINRRIFQKKTQFLLIVNFNIVYISHGVNTYFMHVIDACILRTYDTSVLQLVQKGHRRAVESDRRVLYRNVFKLNFKWDLSFLSCFCGNAMQTTTRTPSPCRCTDRATAHDGWCAVAPPVCRHRQYRRNRGGIPDGFATPVRMHAQAVVHHREFLHVYTNERPTARPSSLAHPSLPTREPSRLGRTHQNEPHIYVVSKKQKYSTWRTLHACRSSGPEKKRRRARKMTDFIFLAMCIHPSTCAGKKTRRAHSQTIHWIMLGAFPPLSEVPLSDMLQ